MSVESLDSVGPVVERAVILLRGMAYEHRLHILMMLQEGEQTPAALAAVIPADPTVIAHHLRFMRHSRLIQRRRHGRHAFYSLYDDGIGRLVTEVLRCVEQSPPAGPSGHP